MRNDDIAVVDCETDAISSRPNYPPKPVGVAIQWPDKSREYLAFGHPTKNNCSVATARQKVLQAYQASKVVFHHASFDCDVLECHMGIKPPKRIEDTLFLAFLKDPDTRELGLKFLGERDAGIKPTERDDLKEWLVDNVKELKRSDKKWGEYICRAPGDLAGEYAMADVRTTGKLYSKYMPEIDERGMRDAYERELKCMTITQEMERSGVRVHRKNLRKCRDVFEKMNQECLKRIAKRLRINPNDLKSPDNKKGFNLNSSDQLADAIMRAGKFDHTVKTPSGKISTKMENLRDGCNDKTLVNLLAVHSVADKYLSTFIKPWLAQAAITDGRILPKFNQVRGMDAGGGGTRTGRYSSSDPNMQQISANVEESKNKETLLLVQKLLKDEYDYPFIGLRDFIIPDEGTLLIGVDYNQQEIRLLAHFARGLLRKMYRDDPNLDVHEFCSQLLKSDFEIDLPRKAVKIIVFGLIYGMGVGKMADGMDLDLKTAKQAKEGILSGIPGIKKLMRELHRLADHDKPVVTWGGREYFCEEPKLINGRMMSWEYKQLNRLIQPSAADYTKQGMIHVAEEVPEVRIAIQVHDELICMAPSEKYGKRIVKAMCREKLDVPMIAEAKMSWKSWARAA